MSGINVQEKNLTDKLSSFSGEINKLNNLAAKLIDETTKLEEFWKGKNGDSAIESLKKYNTVFSKIKEQNQMYVSYVNKVIELYNSAESTTISTMETNSDSLDM